MVRPRRQLTLPAYALLASMACFAFAADSAYAQNWNVDQRTYFTFSGPVELPNLNLPAGRYVFRILDTSGTRQVVQVMADDGNKVHGTFMVISAQRPDVPSKAEVRFMETPSNAPPAVKTWWYPGTSMGKEFIYPRTQALRIAKATNQPVLTYETASVSGDAAKTADLTRVTPSGADTEYTAATAAPTGAATAGEVTSSTNVAQDFDRTPTVVGEQARNTARTSLPSTYSFLPLFGLIGFGSLAGAAFMRYRRHGFRR